MVPELKMLTEGVAWRKMPLLPAEMVPALVMPPEKVWTPIRKMPDPATEIVPLLVMPPEKLVVTPERLMAAAPSPTLAIEIVPLPLLTMPPEKVWTSKRLMPFPDPAEIVPLLVMPPANEAVLLMITAAREPAADITPPLVMPPEKVEAETVTAVPLEFECEIEPLLVLVMPPATDAVLLTLRAGKNDEADMVPLLVMPPIKVPWLRLNMADGPAGPIVPLLITLPPTLTDGPDGTPTLVNVPVMMMLPVLEPIGKLWARAGVAIPTSKATTDVVAKRSRNFEASINCGS